MGLAAPALAIVVAVIVTSVILVVAGDPVGEVEHHPVGAATKGRGGDHQRLDRLLHLGHAVAIGFRMNLFNIGVEGSAESRRSPPPS